MRLQRAIAAVAAVAIVALTVGVVWWGASDSPKVGRAATTSTTAPLTPAQEAERTDATAWETKVAHALEPLVADVQELATGAREFLDGSRPADQFKAEIDKDLADFTLARDQVTALPRFARAPGAQPLYLASTRLYVDVARVYATLVRLPPGVAPDVRTQLDFLARRVRTLADRVYDRGRALVTPLLHETPSPDIDVRLPEEVPEWSAEGIPPGPPLEPQSPPTSIDTQVRKETRPTEDRARWVAAVRAAGIPAAPGADPAALARDEVAAAEKLRNEPDPAGIGGREESARLRLTLLVYADAHRTEQLVAALGPTGTPDPAAIAAELLAVADGLWPGGDLGPRPEGRQ